jgi:predicted thioesterase
MKESLRPGLAFERQITIDRDRTIGFMGEEGRVYATPALVYDIEHACRDLILQHLDAGEDSVGTAIAVEHSAPTPIGMNATIAVTVAAVDGRHVRLDVTARDDVEPICKGTHHRFVVDHAKTVERLKKKSAKR